MKLLAIFLLSLASLSATAQTTPQSSQSIERIKTLILDRKFDEAIAAANTAPRSNYEDRASLACLAWATHKVIITEAAYSRTFDKQRLSKHLVDSCDDGMAGYSMGESIDSASQIIDQLSSSDGRRKFNTTPESMLPHIRGLYESAYEICRETLSADSSICAPLTDALIAIRTFPVR